MTAHNGGHQIHSTLEAAFAFVTEFTTKIGMACAGSADDYDDYGGSTGNAFMIITDNDGVIETHERTNQPCYGELRTYQPAQDKIRKPTDLFWPFPDGTPVGLGVPFSQNNQFAEFLFTNQLSPFRNLVGKCHLLRSATKTGKNVGKIIGVIFTDTHFNSDILVSALFAMRTSAKRITGFVPKDDLDILAEFMLAASSAGNGQVYNGPQKWCNGSDWSPKRIATGMPDVPDNWDWHDRAPYRRPKIENIWAGPGSKSTAVMAGCKKTESSYFYKLPGTLLEAVPVVRKELEQPV